MKIYNYKKINVLFIVLAITFFRPVYSQDSISLKEVFSITLKENLDIKIHTNQLKQAKKQANMGSAGLLPKIQLIGTSSFNRGESSIDFASDNFSGIEGANSESKNINGAIEFSYNLFKGFGAINTLKRLNQQNDFKSTQLQIQIEQALINSAKQYYDIAYYQQLYNLNLKVLKVSKERYNRIVVQNEFGNASSLDLLSAEVDLNNDSINLINTALELNNSKNILNKLLNREIETKFNVCGDVKINKQLNYQKLKQKTLLNNNNIVLQQYMIGLAKTNKSIDKGKLMPIISLKGQYGYSNNQSNTSLILDQTNLGLTGYLNFSFDLFDGMRKRRSLQNLQIEIESNKLKLEAVEKEIIKDLKNTFNEYDKNLNLIRMENRNIVTAEKLFSKSRILFYQGQLSKNDFRLAQVDLKRAKNKLNKSIYLTRLAELNLYRISGTIITP
jgi:outer membrane protein